jgi:serine/threonine-protein kinase
LSLTPGTRLGPYEILAPLGAGGMGEVWKARDTRLDRIVAIKRLMDQHSDRFALEARAIAALNHPHICQIHDVGPDYLVLEYVEGEPLCGPLPVHEAVRLARQIAEALESAHRRGILHRDLKPANVIVTAERSVKLLDFGLAKAITADVDQTRTMDGAVVGTAAYMSPEQAQGKQIDARSDVFAFGVVLYEMLAGTRPFHGTTALQVLTAVLRDEPPRLQAPALDRIVRRCLAKEPSDRFQTMSDVRAALEESVAKFAEFQPSIAVLPFANLSADKENEYFSDGLAEEVLNALTRVPGLRVIARTSSFAFRGKDQDVRRIATALDVRTILEGSVRRAGDRIRITAQLIDAVDGSHLWSDRFDREMTDVFVVQDEISKSIVETLKVKLTAGSAAVSRQKANVEAYHAYLKGRHHLLKLTPDDVSRAKGYLEEAIALDPSYAAAYARLAHALQVSAFMGWEAPRDALPRAKAAASRALALDEHEPDAHMVLAMVAGQFEYDWVEALRHCRFALGCEDVPPDVAGVLASLILVPLGRVDEALSVLERARAVDPLSPFPQQHLAVALSARGSYTEAIDQLQRLLGLHEDFWPAHFFLGGIYAATGMIPEAIATLEKGARLGPSYSGITGLLAGCHALSGDRARADHVLATLPVDRGPRARGLGIFHAICSEFDQAAGYFEQAIEEREPTVTELGVMPFFDRFRTSPHGRALLRKMRLPGV